MLTRVSQRYGIAAVAFATAAIWLGIGLTSAFECLLVFTLAYGGTAVVQQRREAVRRQEERGRRSRRAPAARTRRPDPVVWDDEAEELTESRDWPSLAGGW